MDDKLNLIGSTLDGNESWETVNAINEAFKIALKKEIAEADPTGLLPQCGDVEFIGEFRGHIRYVIKGQVGYMLSGRYPVAVKVVG